MNTFFAPNAARLHVLRAQGNYKGPDEKNKDGGATEKRRYAFSEGLDLLVLEVVNREGLLERLGISL